MSTTNSVERAVSEVRQAAFELNATDQTQALRILHEALKLQPGHADLLGDLATLHLQAGRHRQCLQAAAEALATNPEHDESAFAMALAHEALGELDAARVLYAELADGARAERFAQVQPDLAELCRAKRKQLGAPETPAVDAAAPPTPPAAPAARPAPPRPATIVAPPPSPSDRAVWAPRIARPDSLGRLLDETQGIRALSLDCFDTILWRHTEKPGDVFFAMQQRPAFRAAGIDALGRERGERVARQLQYVRTGRTEVSLEQIYAALRPGLSREMLQWLAEDELAAEIDACHALPGAVQLIREARARGLPVTIVSDTYFDEARLRRLLEATLPADAYAAIGQVVVSSEHGLCKSQGLFKIAQLSGRPNLASVLHVGDNKDADVVAPHAIGMSATHLLHEGEAGMQRQRMGAMALSLLDAGVRAARPLHMPYRGVHATHGHRATTPQAQIGQSALGPLMHAFASWIEDEATALAATRSNVKLVFLMRDAHLPLQVYRASGGAMPAHAAYLSRFSAYAASFRTQDDVDLYLANFVKGLTLPMLARQLLLSPQRAQDILAEAEASGSAQQTFLRLVRQPHVMAEIAAASAAYRERLRRYLEREAGMQPGDTLMLVDLGYAGTIQNVLGGVFQEEWGVEVCGRYLLTVGAVHDRYKGLLDRSWLDDRALGTLQTYIGLLETLSACAGSSAVGYTDDGEPLFEDQTIDVRQSERVDAIQAECVRFAADASAYFRAAGRRPRSTVLRDEALASLGRMLFFPNPVELEHLSRFELEINLGSGVARKLFDLEAGLDGLQRHGLFYLRHAQSGARMALPAELRAAGMELSLSLLTQSRFGLALQQDEWSMRTVPLYVVLTRGEQVAQLSVDAAPTHDGYFSALLPIAGDPTDIGLGFGRDHEWVQLHSVEIVPLNGRRDRTVDVVGDLVLGGIADRGHGLLECESSDGFAMLPAATFDGVGRAALSVVFRPIARREAAAA